MKLRPYFESMFRYSPKRTAFLLFCMVVSGSLEGVSYTLFLPLARLMTERTGFVEYFGVRATFGQILFLVVVLFAMKSLFTYWQKWHASKLALEFERDLKKDIIGASFASDWHFYLNEKVGTMTNALGNQSRLAADAFKMLTVLVTEFLNVAVYCAIGLILSPAAFLLSAILGGACYFFLRNLVTRSRVIGTEATALKSQAIGRAIEDFSGLKTIKGNSLESHRREYLFGLFSRVAEVEKKGERYSAVMEALPDWVMASLVSFILYASYAAFRVPVENLLVLIVVLYRLNRRLMAFQSAKQRFFLYLPSYDFCRNLIAKARASRETGGSRRFECFATGVKLEAVAFDYGGQSVLRSLDLEIRKNTLTAVVGKSGGGKSTLVDLVIGVLRPTAGRVLIDGRDLVEFDLASWRERIAYVSQEPLLVNGSIEENIRMDRLAATQEELQEAARIAHADEFIRRLDDGYATLVGDRGLRLSGGQRQRIALARALLRRPELLVLDEATSALDNESEKMVQDAVESLRGKITILVVAHRLTTIERADVVYTLDGGRTVEPKLMAKAKP